MRYLTLILLVAVAACTTIKPTSRIEFKAPDLYPEGIAYDSVNTCFYVSSVRVGTIGKVDRIGNYNPFYIDSTLKSTYGLKVHNGILYACAGDATFSKLSTPVTKYSEARLLAIDIATKKKLWDIDLSKLVSGKHFVNDMAFDKEGMVYITDSYANAIYRVNKEGQATLVSQNQVFKTEGTGLNGILFHPDGYLLVNSHAKGCLYKVNTNAPYAVQKVNIDQYFMGADGMILLGDNSLVLVANGGNDKVFQLSTADGWNSASVVKSTLAIDRFTHPATATLKEDSIWIMNGRMGELNDSSSVPSAKFDIQYAHLRKTK